MKKVVRKAVRMEGVVKMEEAVNMVERLATHFIHVLVEGHFY